VVDLWVVAPIAHGHSDSPVNLGAAQCGTGGGDGSVVRSATMFSARLVKNPALPGGALKCRFS
jgi:hypothetical protein